MSPTPSEFINARIREGKDIVFSEFHDVMGQTMDYMAHAIEDNPDKIMGVSLELPPMAQRTMDRAARGLIEKDEFIAQMRIDLFDDYIELTYQMLDEGILNEEQVGALMDRYMGGIEAVEAGLNDGFYTPEMGENDQEVFGALYDMIGVASAHNIPVFATDVDRRYVVLYDAGVDNFEDWVNRLEDGSDFSLLEQQVDLTDDRVLLAHRGASHSWNYMQNGIFQNSGLDDYLVDVAGRDVFVLSHASQEMAVTDLATVGDRVPEGYELISHSEATIVDGVVYEVPDFQICGAIDCNIEEPVSATPALPVP